MRRERTAVVAAVARRFGDLDLAEDAFQDAVGEALRTWPDGEPPERPGAWLLTVARRRALDRLRRDGRRVAREQLGDRLDDPARDAEVRQGDDRLALVLTCCHPALAVEARVALTLKAVAGLSTPAIARAFLVPEPTMAQRIVRAKRKITTAGIPFRVPDDPDELAQRLDAVVAVVYLVFNEGYAVTEGGALVRDDLCDEAIALARLLVEVAPDDAEVAGLLGLLLLTDARRTTRVDAAGDLVLLEDQDRSRWDRARLDEGIEVLRAHPLRGPVGPYRVQAEIAVAHALAPSYAATDWRSIVTLYDLALRVSPGSAVIGLNRAVAVAMVDGPEAGLALVDELAAGGELDRYGLLHATRADLLRRLGRADEAALAYDAALLHTTGDAERRFLARRRAEVAPPT